MMHTYIFERTSYGKERELVKKEGGERCSIYLFTLQMVKMARAELVQKQKPDFFFFSGRIQRPKEMGCSLMISQAH